MHVQVPEMRRGMRVQRNGYEERHLQMSLRRRDQMLMLRGRRGLRSNPGKNACSGSRETCGKADACKESGSSRKEVKSLLKSLKGRVKALPFLLLQAIRRLC